MNQTKNLAIFDLDGTLLDTIGDLACACNHMLAMRSLALHAEEEYRTMVGNGITRLVERALPEELRTAEYVEKARLDFLEYYVGHIDQYTYPYLGIREVLHTLQEQGWALAVASNKFDAGTKQLVAKFFPDIEFGAIYGNREGFPLKPDKAILELIIEECGSSAERCYMIGDSAVDIQCARNAGCYSVGCVWGFRSRDELEQVGTDLIVERPCDILKIVSR